MGTQDEKSVLTVNAGSSSIKVRLYDLGSLKPRLQIKATNIGQPKPMIFFDNGPKQNITAETHAQAFQEILKILHQRLDPQDLVAIGHRLVHGGPDFTEPAIISTSLISSLKKLATYDPEHTPNALQIIESSLAGYPNAAQIACFDTAFFKDLPSVAKLLPIPRKYADLGLRRYGFHGLSYSFILEEFGRQAGDAAAHGRVIVAHLGSGSSLSAIHNGKPVDTTMSFTTASGIPMSTRSGDIDPGIFDFLQREAGQSIHDTTRMLHFESGMLGLSGSSSDMEQLIQGAGHNQDSNDAVMLFCYYVKKAIGSLSAALGGVDSLIFTGGIGENAPLIRQAVCTNLDHLGIKLNEDLNKAGDFLISSNDSRVGVHVIKTDEEQIIARQTKGLISGQRGAV